MGKFHQIGCGGAREYTVRVGRVVGAAPLRLAPCPRKHDMHPWEVGGGRAPRQPGQVRKEAAAVSFRSGRLLASHRLFFH